MNYVKEVKARLEKITNELNRLAEAGFDDSDESVRLLKILQCTFKDRLDWLLSRVRNGERIMLCPTTPEFDWFSECDEE